MTDSTPICAIRFEHVKHINMHVVPRTLYTSRFSGNASELLENFEEISHQYYP